MESYKEQVEEFENGLKSLLFKGHIVNCNDLAYVICYLCYINCKLKNSPYNCFEEEFVNSEANSFDSFINAVERSFSKLKCGTFENYIIKSIGYLRDNRYGNVDGKRLLNLLKTQDVYFYETILTTNTFENGNFDYPSGVEATPNELIEIFKYFKTGRNSLDVGCGNGNVLVGLLNDSGSNDNADGIEINERSAFISELRLSLYNDINSDIIVGDYLTTHIDKKYSFITINMPFGARIPFRKRNEFITPKKDYKFDWNMAPAVSLEWLYVNKALNLLSENGRIVLVTPQTALFKNGDEKVRKDLIENNLIEYVIDMPFGTYPNAKVNYSIVVLNNAKKDDFVKYINASEYFVLEGKNTKKIDVCKLIKALINETYENVSNSFILENDYMLLTTKHKMNKPKLKHSIKLSDLNVEVMRGLQNCSKSELKLDGKYSIVTISDIDDNGNVAEDLGKFETSKDIDKYLLKENDILISTKGTRIKTCLVSNLKNKNTIYHGNLSLIRVADDKLDPVFLKLYLDSEIGQAELNSIQTGINIISINTTQLSNISIPLINIEEQKKFVNNYLNKKNEIDNLTNKLNNLKKNLSDEVNQIFEEIKE